MNKGLWQKDIGPEERDIIFDIVSFNIRLFNLKIMKARMKWQSQVQINYRGFKSLLESQWVQKKEACGLKTLLLGCIPLFMHNDDCHFD